MSKLNKLYDKSKSFLHFQENSNPKLNKFFLNELRKVSKQFQEKIIRL